MSSRITKKSKHKKSKNKKASHSRIGKIKVKSLVRSPIKGKKFRMNFSDGTHTDFGASGYSDFTKHRNPARKQRYINRHKSRENWNNFKSRGSLSRYILWNKPTIKASLADYKRKFNL